MRHIKRLFVFQGVLEQIHFGPVEVSLYSTLSFLNLSGDFFDAQAEKVLLDKDILAFRRQPPELLIAEKKELLVFEVCKRIAAL